MKTALSIAGSDCSGGAGIQADIKTMTACGVYAMSAVTALTAQNTTGVTGILNVPPEFLEKQLDSIFTDIFPDAVKIGMVSTAETAETIARKLKFYGARHIVADPVMVATSGARLIGAGAAEALRKNLFGLAELLTPNLPEAEVLSEMEIHTREELLRAAERISRAFGCAVLCKGGHRAQDADDLLFENGTYEWFRGERIPTSNTHGTGCTLSSAVASCLAKGDSLREAVRKAKEYITGALLSGLDLGKGSGPLNHIWNIETKKG